MKRPTLAKRLSTRPNSSGKRSGVTRRAALPIHGFLVALAAVAVLSIMDAVMKHLVLAIGIFAVSVWRALANLIVAAALYLPRKLPWPSRATMRLHLLRAVVVTVMAFLFFWGIGRVPLAQAIALTFIAPLIAMLLAVPLLGETIGRSSIVGSLAAFAGVIVIVIGQARGTLGEGVLLGTAAILGSALCYAFNIVLMRHQALAAKPLEITFFQSLTVLVLWLAVIADDARLAELKPDSLRFFINGQPVPAISTLISAPGGGLTANGASYSLGTVYNATNFTLALQATDTTLLANRTTVAGLAQAYWSGGYTPDNDTWAASNGSNLSNWVTNSDGTGNTGLVPGAGTDVFFSATGATLPAITTLGADMEINSLTVTTASALTLSAPDNRLTIHGNNAITVASGAGAVILDVMLDLEGTAPVISVDNTGGLALVGGTSRSNWPFSSSVSTYTLPSVPTRTSRMRLPRSLSRRSSDAMRLPSRLSRIRLRSASAPRNRLLFHALAGRPV